MRWARRMQWTSHSNSTTKRRKTAQVFSPAIVQTVLLHRTPWLSCGQASPERGHLQPLVCQNGPDIPLRIGQACALIPGARWYTTDSARRLPCGERLGNNSKWSRSIGTLIGATHKGACRGVCSEISHRVQDRTLSVLPHFLWSMGLTTQEPADGADRTPTDRSHCA